MIFYFHFKSSTTQHKVCQSPSIIMSRSAEQHEPWWSRRSNQHFLSSTLDARTSSPEASEYWARFWSSRSRRRQPRFKRCWGAAAWASTPSDCRAPGQAKWSSSKVITSIILSKSIFEGCFQPLVLLPENLFTSLLAAHKRSAVWVVLHVPTDREVKWFWLISTNLGQSIDQGSNRPIPTWEGLFSNWISFFD